MGGEGRGLTFSRDRSVQNQMAAKDTQRFYFPAGVVGPGGGPAPG